MTDQGRPAVPTQWPAFTAPHRGRVDGHYRARARGTAYGLLAHTAWGAFPLYFHALPPAGPWEVLAHRVMWTLLTCTALLTVRKDWGWIRPLVSQRRAAAEVVTAAGLIASNWVVYVYAVISGHVIEAALGYFLTPLVTVAVGVLVLRESLSRAQWVAVGLGVVAATYLSADYGHPPWIALAVAVTFAGYGLAKKRLGATLTAVHSLTAETTVLLPVAVIIPAVLAARSETTLLGHGRVHAGLLLSAGVVTTIPMLLFAAAATRIPLSRLGLVQFVTPVLQLLCGVLLLGESMPASRWVGFAILWVALTVLSTDAVRTIRSQHGAPVHRAPPLTSAAP